MPNSLNLEFPFYQMISYALLSLFLTLKMGGLISYSPGVWDYATSQSVRQKIIAVGHPALPYLEKALIDPKVSNWVIAETFGQIGGKTTYPLLRKLAESSPSPVAAYAVAGLGYTKDPRALSFLLDQLKGRYPETAVAALGNLGSAKAVPHLVRLLDEGADGGGDQFAFSSLGRISAIALSKLGHPGAAALATALNSPESSDQVRRRAAEGLEFAQDLATRDELAKFLRSDGDEEATEHATYALALLRDKRAFPSAQRLVASDYTCDMGYSSLLALGDEQSLSIVLPGVSGSERRAQCLIEALQKFKTPTAVAILLKLVQRPEPEVQRSAIYALNAIGDPAAVPALERLWPTSGDRYGDIEAALMKMGHSGVGALIRIYRRQPQNGYREAILQLLGEAGDPAAIPLLKEALSNPLEFAREDARRSLIRIAVGY